MNQSPAFHGSTFVQELDGPRLTRQFDRVKNFMLTVGGWHTLREIANAADGTEASVSARLRDLRKPENGSYRVDRRRRGEPENGLHEYRVLPNGELPL